LAFVIEECVYWTVRFESLNIFQLSYGIERVKNHFCPKQVNVNFSVQILVQLMNNNNNNNNNNNVKVQMQKGQKHKTFNMGNKHSMWQNFTIK
jgi:hypothetical protein